MDPAVEKATEILTEMSEQFKDGDYMHLLKLLGQCNELLLRSPQKQRRPEVMSWDDPLMAPYVQEGMAALSMQASVVAPLAHQAPQTHHQEPLPDIPEKTVSLDGRQFVLYHRICHGKPIPTYEERQIAKNTGVIYHYAGKDSYSGLLEHYLLKPSTGNLLVLHGVEAKTLCGFHHNAVYGWIYHPQTIPIEPPAAPPAGVVLSPASTPPVAPTTVPTIKRVIPKKKQPSA